MGVYIPNIEMPKTCGECELRALDEWEEEYCVILKSDILVPYERMLDCPLIEIVRCKECKWCDNGIDEDGKPFLKCLGIHYGGTKAESFCSYGERRTDDSN